MVPGLHNPWDAPTYEIYATIQCLKLQDIDGGTGGLFDGLDASAGGGYLRPLLPSKRGQASYEFEGGQIDLLHDTGGVGPI